MGRLLNRAARVELALGRQVGGMGVVRVVEKPEAHDSSVHTDGREEPTRSPNERHPKPAGQVAGPRLALVLLVDAAADAAQVAPPVVGPVAVDVVNFSARPLAAHPEPRNSVGLVGIPVDANPDVAVWPFVAYDGAGWRALGRNSSRESSGIRVVVDEAAQSLGRKIGSSHEAPRMLIGQRPDGATNAARPCHFHGSTERRQG